MRISFNSGGGARLPSPATKFDGGVAAQALVQPFDDTGEVSNNNTSDGCEFSSIFTGDHMRRCQWFFELFLLQGRHSAAQVTSRPHEKKRKQMKAPPRRPD